MVIARQGICVNTASCPISKANEIITVPRESSFHCPVCGQELREVKIKAPSKPKRVLLGAAATALILLVLAFAFVKNRMALPLIGALPWSGASPTILRLAGSNTIGDSLGPALAAAFLKDQGATAVRILPGSQPDEKTVQGILPGDRFVSSITIAAHGSATAFQGLAANRCDIGAASRRINPAEAAKLASMGNFYSAGSEHILGLDGIAVIVNSANPVTELSVDQLRRIFAGKMTNWSEAGPSHGGIDIYARNDNSGTYDTFKSLILSGLPLTSSAQRFEDSNALSAAVSADPNGIGFIGLPFVHNARALAVSEQGTGALLPTKLTVATEDYALARRLYLYTPANPRNKYTRMFVAFALSKQGQDVVGANGFVAQTAVPESQAVFANAPIDYRQLTQNAERLPLDFRFQFGESVQDNKALVDMDRVVSMIADQKIAGSKLMLFGFADNIGTPAANQALSLDRARVIEGQFVQRGIKPAVVRGFGSSLPVASNESANGREKNRRVEIWIQK